MVENLGDRILAERKKLISEFKDEVGRSDGSRPLNIIFIGITGSGKSSAINTIAAAFSDDHWREYAVCGKAGGKAPQMTFRLRSFTAKQYCKSEKLAGYAMPTLIDLAGFEDEDTDLNAEIIRIILYGDLPPGESPYEAYMYGKVHGIDQMRQKYCGHNFSWFLKIAGYLGMSFVSKLKERETKVDRIVFVASSQQNTPVQLINCVMRASRPLIGAARREIPIFGLMTKIDKIDESSDIFKERKENFIENVSLEGATHRYAQCVNYCDDVDPEVTRMEQTMPDIDVPMLKFMKVICGDNFEVPNNDETIYDAIGRSPNDQMQMLCTLLFFVLIAFVSIWFFSKILER